MKFDPTVHHRHSIRLKGFDYTQSGGYYVTILTLQRECLFGEIVGNQMRLNALGKIVQEEWFRTAALRSYVELRHEEFVVMPNHIHGIIWIHNVGARRRRAPTPTIEQFSKPSAGSLPTIVRAFKAAVTHRAGKELDSGNIWQRNYYEHILRDQSDWECISAYISDNPLNWKKDEENPANSTPCCASGANDRIELNM